MELQTPKFQWGDHYLLHHQSQLVNSNNSNENTTRRGSKLCSNSVKNKRNLLLFIPERGGVFLVVVCKKQKQHNIYKWKYIIYTYITQHQRYKPSWSSCSKPSFKDMFILYYHIIHLIEKIINPENTFPYCVFSRTASNLFARRPAVYNSCSSRSRQAL